MGIQSLIGGMNSLTPNINFLKHELKGNFILTKTTKILEVAYRD